MPVIPHLASESLQLIGYKQKISWPLINKELLIEEDINYVIQVNGKKRGLIKTKRNISEKELFKLIEKKAEIYKHVNNKKIIKHWSKFMKRIEIRWKVKEKQWKSMENENQWKI